MPPQHPTARPAHAPGLSGAVVLLVAAFCVALTRVIYIFTYPLNNLGGDSSNYYYMLINGTTNLTHASGYPFIVRTIARFIAGSGDISSPTFSFAVLAIQNSIEVITLSVIAVYVRRIFGIVTALIFLALTGFSVFAMSWTSAAYPEWLQSCLLLITLFLVVGAISCTSILSKFLLYALAFLAFAWAYLTKYNSGIFLPLFLIPLVMECRAIGSKAALFLLAPAPALASVFLFIVNVHLPSSGTTALHHDAAWVLMCGLGNVDGHDNFAGHNVLLDDPGPYALQWLAVSAILPPVYDRAGAWTRIDNPPRAGEEEAVKKYRSEYLRLSNLSSADLKLFLNEHPLPKEFVLNNSPIPVYEFLGLEAGDKLGTKVFIEYMLRHPMIFILSTIKKSLTFALTDLTYDLMPGIHDGIVKVPGDKLASGFALYSSALPLGAAHYKTSSAMLFWEPGIALFKGLEKWRPGRLTEFVCSAFSIGWAMAVTIRRRRLMLGPGIVFTLAIALLAFVLASNMILVLRDKEVRAVWPLACLFWAAGIGSIAQQVVLWFSGKIPGVGEEAVP